MQKTLLASAMTLALGGAASVNAATITITQMDFSGLSAATGTVNDAATGQFSGVFFGHNWVADQVAWFDTHSSTITTTVGDPAANGGVYTFHLTGNQVAAATLFDWSTSLDIAVLTIFDCPVSGGGNCTGASLPMAGGPFAGSSPGFNGTTVDDFPSSGVAPIPVPAAVWLFGSGLLGLVGVARRRRKA